MTGRGIASADGLGFRTALHAEWTKVRTVAGPAWLLVATAALTIGVGAVATASSRCPSSLTCAVDTPKLTFTGVYLSQAVVAVLAVLVIGSEYSTGMIRVTLAAVPHRSILLATKAVVLTALVTVAGTVGVLGSLLVGRLILPGHGFTTSRGFPALSLADGPVLRAAAGSVLYLALVGLLGLGIATLVRDSGIGVGVVLGLLYLYPIVVAAVDNPNWQRHLNQVGPMAAGLAIQATRGLRSLPISPWAGLGVLACWATGALLAGGLVLRLRDA